MGDRYLAAELKSIRDSQGLKNIIRDHKEVLQKKVNEYIREGDQMAAYGELCKLDDIDKIFILIDRKLEQLQGGN